MQLDSALSSRSRRINEAEQLQAVRWLVTGEMAGDSHESGGDGSEATAVFVFCIVGSFLALFI